MSLEPDEFQAAVAYRIAYGWAADELERLKPGEATDGQIEALKARLIAEAPPDDDLAREAIEDAVAGRRPRY